MKKILGLCLVIGLGLGGCSSSQVTSSPNITKNEFDGSETISFKPVNIVCSYAICPNLGFSWNEKVKDMIGVTIVMPNQIKGISAIDFNIDGEISSFNAKNFSDIQIIPNYKYSAQTILVPVSVLDKAKTAKEVKVRISGPSFVQNGSLRMKDGSKILAARNLDSLLDQIKN